MMNIKMIVTMMMMAMMMTVVEIVWRIKACGRPHTESTSGGWRHLKLYRLHIIKRRKQGGCWLACVQLLDNCILYYMW